jgi:hypothetical protein
MEISSVTIKMFNNFLATESNEKIKFVDQVYSLCEKNYKNGGDRVVDSFTPLAILKKFKTLKDVKKYCSKNYCPKNAYDNFKEKWLD